MSVLKRIALFFFRYLSAFSRKLAQFSHAREYHLEWGSRHPPEWFNHFYDQFFLWRSSREPFWLERGIFNLLAVKPDAKALELCCGDGYNTFHFYSGRVKSIIAVDFDAAAIAHAKKYNQFSNIEYRVCDIRTDIPGELYDNIILDAAIQHFSDDEIKPIMTNIKTLLAPGGVLSGYCILEKVEGEKTFSYHEREIKSKEELNNFFTPYFKNILIFETAYPSRNNLYFFVSDGIIPFSRSWSSMLLSEIGN